MNSDVKPKLSIIIPCHNEAEGLPELVSAYAVECKKHPNVEVIIVNDASSDNSSLILEGLSRNNQFLRVVTNNVSNGYGNAILSGLRVAEGEWLGWTHGDSQTPPEDVFTALSLIETSGHSRNLYLKGRRYGRPILDRFFTFGMSLLETVYLRAWLVDINAQPNIFHRFFYDTWKNPPSDFSLDLYVLYLARRSKLKLIRFPVHFGPRKYGNSTWNTGLMARLKFIKRTLRFTKTLKASLTSSFESRNERIAPSSDSRRG